MIISPKNKHGSPLLFSTVLLIVASLVVPVWILSESAHAATADVIWLKWAKWGIPGGGEGAVIGDVNNDGQQEVVYAASGRAVALRGTDGSYLWDVSVPGVGDTTHTQMADLDKDGYLEIVAPIEEPPAGFYILDGRTGAIEQKTNQPGRTDGSPVIGDIDGDGYPTLFFSTMSFVDNYDDSNGTGWIRSYKYNMGSSPRYAQLSQTKVWHPCSGGLSLADTDHDGEFELYMGDRNIYYDRGYGGGVMSFWARNLTDRWRHPDLIVSSHVPMLADVNRDGILDVIATHQRGGIAVLNSKDGSAIKKQLTIYNSKGQPVSGHYQSSVYDIDHDGNLEILMADGEHDITHDAVAWDLVKWKEDARIPSSIFGQSFFGPQVGDVTGDGKMDIILAGYTGLYIFDGSHDPSLDGTYPLIDSQISLQSRLTYAVVQDIDNDAHAEVIVASQGGVIYAFDTPAPAPYPRPRTEVPFNSERRLGAAEYVPPPSKTPEPLVSNPTPSDWATNVPISTSQLSFSLKDYENNAMSYFVTTSPNVGSGSGVGVPNGRYSLSIGSLSYSKLYTWYVKVTDGARWTNTTYTFRTMSQPVANSPPSQGTPLLIQAGGTSNSLTVYNQSTFDLDGNKVTNVYHWIKNDASTTNLLMPFDTASSTMVRDYSGYDNNGRIVRNVTWTSAGVVGGAYSFNGGYITIPDSNTLDGNYQWYEMSAEMWLCLTADQRGTRVLFKQPSYQVGFQTSPSGAANRIYAGIWTLRKNPDTTVGGLVQTYIEAGYSTALTRGVWYHVAFTYKYLEGVKLYLNGALVSSVGQSSSDFGYIERGLQPLYLGWFDYFKGKLDEVRIYPKRLSASQIYQDYVESKTGLSKSSTIVYAELKTGDAWKCQVTPSDSLIDGASSMSNITIVSSGGGGGTTNTPPTASNLQIKPNIRHRCLDSSNLVGSYIYYDANGDLQSGTEIRWYKNGVLQSALNNQLIVPYSLTYIGDSWYFTVRPKDGKTFGTLQKSYTIRIVQSYH